MRYLLIILALVFLGLALDSWLDLPPNCGGRYNPNSRSEACKQVNTQVLKKLWDKTGHE